MARIDELILEINEMKKQATRRSALGIYNILFNNSKLFVPKIESGDFNLLVKSFENLGNSTASQYNDPSFKRDYDRAFETLMFYLNRIV